MLFRARLGAIVQRWNMGTGSRHTHLGLVMHGAVDVATSDGDHDPLGWQRAYLPPLELGRDKSARRRRPDPHRHLDQ
jgi:hypothetical protein